MNVRLRVYEYCYSNLRAIYAKDLLSNRDVEYNGIVGNNISRNSTTEVKTVTNSASKKRCM